MQYYFLYILQCSDGSYYVGHTDDIDKRIAEHMDSRYMGYTAWRLPIELVYLESCSSRDEAFIAEHKIKKWTRKKKEQLIKHGWEGMRRFGKKK